MKQMGLIDTAKAKTIEVIKMDALTFRKKLLDGLNRLTDEDVKRIRDELDLHHDYSIDQNGITHIVEKNIDTLSNKLG